MLALEELGATGNKARPRPRGRELFALHI